MADYYSPTIVQQVIPLTDMTPLERLILSHVFDSEPDGDGLYLFAETGPRDLFDIPARRTQGGRRQLRRHRQHAGFRSRAAPAPARRSAG